MPGILLSDPVRGSATVQEGCVLLALQLLLLHLAQLALRDAQGKADAFQLIHLCKGSLINCLHHMDLTEPCLD